MTAGFDGARYKATARQHWDDAAAAWHRWHPTLEHWLGPATSRMLDLAEVGPGDQILDIAAGAGQQTLEAARRVGPSGCVLATDLSANLLDFAQSEAEEAGLSNVRTQVMDAEHLDLPDDSFDAVICRQGLMYIPDLHSALTSMYRVLKPGGRLAAVVFSTLDRNPFCAIPGGIIFERLQLLPPAPGQAGPFSLADPGVLERAFLHAGFRDTHVEPLEAPLRMQSAKECARFQRESFADMDQLMFKLEPSECDAVWQQCAESLAQFEGPEGFAGPAELLIAAARK